MATAAQVITKCNTLKKNWTTRHGKFKDWYDLLTLKDVLKQEGMESVTSNDPRTAYNLAKHLLTSSIISHRVPSEELLPEQVIATSYLESYITKQWIRQEKRYRGVGRQSFIGELVAFMLATGWYAMFAYVDAKTPPVAEVWNPAEVFPDFGVEGTIECAHIYQLSPAAANRKVNTMGWPVRTPFQSNVTLYDYWFYDADGVPANSIVLARDFVKEPIQHPDLQRLPIFTSPVGGLPDRGTIATGTDWQKHCGEALVATDEDILVNYNKILTYIQQLVRDVANPRWFEKSTGDTPILTAANLFKRGAIFRGGPQDEIGPLPVPPIPVELRTMLFDYQNMIQRGLFPWAVYGNIQQQMSSIAMANIASAALQVLTPYHEAIKGVLTDIDNFWIGNILKGGYTFDGFAEPENLPEEVEFDVDFAIDIPGYTLQRITAARMVDPTFRLSTTTTMEKFFPEIRDTMREIARARRDDAMNHPKAIMADQIIAYKEHAQLLRDANNADAAAIYEKLAKSLEAELEAPEIPRPRAPAAALEEVPREVMPREAMTPAEGMTREV